ncbi:MAG: hypothetical protein Q9198_003793 [Flavoplaca austrocitrina]
MSSCPVPSYINQKNVADMRYNVKNLESMAVIDLALENDRLRIQRPNPKDKRAPRLDKETLIKSLIDYTKGNAILNTRPLRLSERGTKGHKKGFRGPKAAQKAKAVHLNLPLSSKINGKQRWHTAEELQSAIEEAESHEENRAELGLDPLLPQIQITRSAILVILLSRFSSWPTNKRLNAANSEYTDIKEMLCQGQLLANLKDATFRRVIWTNFSARLPMPLHRGIKGGKLVEPIQLFQQGRGKIEVILVICGIEGLSVNLSSYKPFLAAFQDIKFTLVIGESTKQWLGAGVLWAPSDWSTEILGRRWAKVDLRHMIDHPDYCRLYRGIIEQWGFCFESRTEHSAALKLDRRPKTGRTVAKRQKK